MPPPLSNQDRALAESHAFYREAVHILEGAGVPFLIGGAYAFRYHTGIIRDTKDLDVFVRRDDWQRALEAFASAGCRTEATYPHWLGKAFRGDSFVDVIH